MARFELRLSDAEKEQLQQNAADAGLPMAEFIRVRCGLDAAEPEEPMEGQLGLDEDPPEQTYECPRPECDKKFGSDAVCPVHGKRAVPVA